MAKTIPAFHTRAAAEAEKRFKSLREQRDQADSFLDEIDDLLTDEEA